MNIPYVMRKCTCCGEWKVASTVNFYKHKGSRYELHSKCKKCFSKYRKQYYKSNKEKEAERLKQYRKKNKDKISKYNKQYCDVNKDKMAERHKQWYENNREKALEQKKQYHQSPQGQAVRFNSSNKRRLKEQEQGTGITKDQWLEMMQYFDWRCAYSGEVLSKDTRSVDHIVPIDAGGDNMIWNMVPMTRSLNSSKNSKDMLEWYREQSFYSEARLAKIYEWQEHAYNKWGKNTQYFNSGDIQIKLI